MKFEKYVLSKFFKNPGYCKSEIEIKFPHADVLHSHVLSNVKPAHNMTNKRSAGVPDLLPTMEPIFVY